ncbi:Crp/Fnr family transcriptional regulator [Actinacidiphila rubida]|uniref:cAMP-binding domain of CRP or a regulatory subunit of cAMP-dependent protein kinases n=1 Tax=Actinacidiphila rubida TaxID=310780 RepID=A0A1H8GJ27_9ACTN|nr:Crp/Fnr family transcriptional regulator [Actinacidiphila rubida]SEN43790.1 cAMP-binding domain of CRP or a regulatory subunit of cAMP-dependent protein kinases [Actinacidiphila rubida]
MTPHEEPTSDRRTAADQSFWSLLDAPTRNALRAAGHLRTYAPRTLLLRQDDRSDHIFVLRSGCVKVYTDSDTGYRAVLALRSAGDLVGEQSGLNRRPRSASVCALIEVQALVVTAGRFGAMLKASPVVAHAVQQVLSQRLRDADRQRAAVGSASPESRLAGLLIQLAGRYGVRTADGSVRIELPLSQEDLAGLLVSSLRTVSRILEHWRREGILTTGRQVLELADLRALRERANTPGELRGSGPRLSPRPPPRYG